MKKELSTQAKHDLELIRQFRSGRKEAAEELFIIYKPLVISRANRYFLQGGDQEDLIQEGMIGLFQAMGTYDLDSGLPFSALADQVIRSRLIDTVRSGSRQKHKILNESISLEVKATEDSDLYQDIYCERDIHILSPEDRAIAKEELEAFQAFMQNNLSPLEAKVATLLGQGYSYQGAAQALNKDVKSIDNAVQRIRRKMKQVDIDVNG